MQHRTALSNDFLISDAPGAAHYIPDFITVQEEEYLLRKIDESPKLKWKTLGNRRLQLWGGEILRKNTLFREPMPPFLKPYPDIIGRLKETKAFQSSPHGEPNHVILNEYLPGQGIMVRKPILRDYIEFPTFRFVKPHEDGPSYHPVVATISLGSHTVFHYYAYSGEQTLPDVLQTKSGRVIQPTPVLSVFLEPRSVIITTGELYTSHLHGIEDLSHDAFLGDGRVRCQSGKEVKLSNWRSVREDGMKDVLQSGGELARKTRLSLTCRDVEKVATPVKVRGAQLKPSMTT